MCILPENREIGHFLSSDSFLGNNLWCKISRVQRGSGFSGHLKSSAYIKNPLELLCQVLGCEKERSKPYKYVRLHRVPEICPGCMERGSVSQINRTH